jgi:hypothetical protein
MSPRPEKRVWKSFADPMKKLQSLASALAILALGFLVVATIVFLLVDAILGGVL